MAAPSGLTRFTTSLCVGPLPAPRRGGAKLKIDHCKLRIANWKNSRRVTICNSQWSIFNLQSSSFWCCLDRRLLDRHVFHRPVAAASLDGADGANRLHRFLVGDFTESRVLPVEARVFLQADEELRACRIWIAGPRHGQHAGNVRRAVEFRLNLVARTAGAGSFGAAPLDHETRDDSVKDHVVVETDL